MDCFHEAWFAKFRLFLASSFLSDETGGFEFHFLSHKSKVEQTLAFLRLGVQENLSYDAACPVF